MRRRSSGRARGEVVVVAASCVVLLGGCGGLTGSAVSEPTGSASVAPTRTTAPEATTLEPVMSPSAQVLGTSVPAAPAPTESTASTASSPVATPARTSPPPSTPTSAKPTSAPVTPSPVMPSPVTPPPTTAPPTTPTPAPRTTLQIGDRGPTVLHLQERLSELGYWLGTPDGTFGGLTQQAVFALQKAAGIGRDGVVGPTTTAALEAGVRPDSRAGGTGVEIDLDRQLLLVVRDGTVTRILNTSTGNGEQYVSRGTTKIARTPTGAFAVYRQVDALDVAELGELYRPKYFYKGWAVHGSTSVPPYPASHGCARLTNAAMNMIWAQAYLTIGTPVTVY